MSSVSRLIQSLILCLIVFELPFGLASAQEQSSTQNHLPGTKIWNMPADLEHACGSGQRNGRRHP
ncbi:MAG: hypothetical protein NT172_11885 [Planctomycetota bacterium]|nr:hypothetical protein [Planctomycetota bacterium]